MAFERRGNFIVWALSVAAMVLSFCAGWLYGKPGAWWIVPVVCSLLIIVLIIRKINRVGARLRFVIDATLNGDFSYKFPVKNVSAESRDVNEMLNRIVVHLEDITAESRRNETFLVHVLNLVDIGFVVADSLGNVTIHNQAALRLLDRDALTNVCQIPEGEADSLDIRRRDVVVNERSFIIFTINDFGHRMQRVEVESWEKLTRVLTHEIMNSMTPIRSIAETMSEQSIPGDIKDGLETISSSSRSLMRFVRNFREFSFLPEPKMRPFYLKPFLESCVRMARGYLDDRDVEISLLCFPPEMMVYSDDGLLTRVLLNIIKNAIEANPEKIEIEANMRADESVEIAISNDGELIPEEVAAQMFTPFFTTRTSGSGIGLSLSRRIVTHLGGTLSFKTKPSTSFLIRI